jgi:hypothetical protein
MAHMAACLPGKCKALSSNPSTAKKSPETSDRCPSGRDGEQGASTCDTLSCYSPTLEDHFAASGLLS